LERFDHIDWLPAVKLWATTVGAMAAGALLFVGAGFGLNRLFRHYRSKKTQEKGDA
jgi:hypothetical protein